VLVSPSLVRDLLSFATPPTKPKVLYRQVTLLLSMGSFRLHAVYHVPSELTFLSYLYQYPLRYPRIFFILFTSTAWTPFTFLFLVVREVALVTFSGNNASLHFGVGVLFPSGLICVFN